MLVRSGGGNEPGVIQLAIIQLAVLLCALVVVVHVAAGHLLGTLVNVQDTVGLSMWGKWMGALKKDRRLLGMN